MSNKQQANATLFFVVGILALAIGFFSYKFLLGPKPLNIIDTLPKLNAVVSFNGKDHNDNSFSEKEFIGKWSIVFFGFTTCPDICPTTMMDMNSVEKGIDKKWEADTQFVFITVDPERDTVPALKKYVPAFNPKFIGVRLEMNDLKNLTKSLGVAFMKTKSHDGNPDNYMVDHTARWFIIDPLGRRYALINPSNAYNQDLVALVVDDYNNLRKQTKR